MKKKSSNKKVFLIVGIVLVAFVLYWVITGTFILGIMYLISKDAKVEVNTDIGKYQDYIGENAQEEYQNKWDMDESIFPEEITDEMDVKDYKMVYYNPWDAQYLSYLVVDYDEEDFKKETERLTKYPSTKYLGYYGAAGFLEEYELLAMYADEYQGFVYALSDKENTVIYVEIIFCNYMMDIDYKEYIKEEYLPLGFDATDDNPYKSKQLDRK